MKYLAAIAMMLITPAFAEDVDESSAVTFAEEYLAAYSTFDTALMEPFLSDDMVFYDPTSSTQNADGGPFWFTGKNAVLKGLGDYAGQFASFSVSYNVERQYDSQGVVVFIGQLGYEGETNDGRTFDGSLPVVTAVTVKDGAVVKHTDFLDYNGNAVDFSSE